MVWIWIMMGERIFVVRMGKLSCMANSRLSPMCLLSANSSLPSPPLCASQQGRHVLGQVRQPDRHHAREQAVHPH